MERFVWLLEYGLIMDGHVATIKGGIPPPTKKNVLAPSFPLDFSETKKNDHLPACTKCSKLMTF